MTREELLQAAEELQDNITSVQMKAEGEEDAILEAAYKAMNAVIRKLEA